MPEVVASTLAGTPWEFWAARLTDRGSIRFEYVNAKPQTATKVYTVLIPQHSEFAIASVTGLPAIGAAYNTTYTELIAQSYDVQCENATAGVWSVTVNYGIPDSVTSEGSGEDPTFVYRNITFGFSTSVQDCSFDVGTQRLIANLNQEAFDYVPERTFYAPTISFQRLETSAPDPLKIGTINSESKKIMGITFAKHCALLTFTSEKLATPEGGYNYLTSYTIEGRRNPCKYREQTETTVHFGDIGWDISTWEVGWNVLDANSELKRADIRDDGQGNVVYTANPVPLKIKQGAEPSSSKCGEAATSMSEYTYTRWQIYEDNSWSSFHFPETVPGAPSGNTSSGGN